MSLLAARLTLCFGKVTPYGWSVRTLFSAERKPDFSYVCNDALSCGVAAKIWAEIDGDSFNLQVILCVADCWLEMWVLSDPLNSLWKHDCNVSLFQSSTGQRPGPSPQGNGSCEHTDWNVGSVTNTSSIQWTRQGLEDSVTSYGPTLHFTLCSEPEICK